MPTYTKAPIQEALIDIKVSYTNPFDPVAVEAFHETLIDDLPQKNVKNSVVFNITEKGASANTSGVDGFMFRAGDGSRVLQVTREGFTFSIINTYTEWQDFLNQTLSYWERFLENFPATSVTRIGVRYINKIDLPVDTTDLSDYFTTRAITGVDNNPVELFLRAVIPYEGYTCIITQATNPSLQTPEHKSVILDIDVFSEQPIEPVDTDRLTETLAGLRNVKNDAFEKSLTSRAKELFN